MIKKFNLIFFIILLLINKNILALEGECYFEEVYKNGEIQNGLLLVSDEDIRYEYFKPQLFTIISTLNDFYLIENSNKNNFEKIKSPNLLIFQNLKKIILEYPNIKNSLSMDGYFIEIERGNSEYFPKRIILKSEKMNLSIYLRDCKIKPINKLFFKYNPMFEYPK